MNIRYPNITGKTPVEQIEQLRRFLYTLVEQLNMQEENGNNPSVASGASSLYTREPSGGAVVPATTPMSTFNQIKDLIIKSADIIDAYSEEINQRLSGEYVAVSDYGTYTAKTDLAIQANAENIDQHYTKVQSIEGQLNEVIATSANIRAGRLFTVGEETLEPELGQTIQNGVEIYGVEVGQTTTVDGVEVFNKFARFTSYGMTLYDNNGNLSAYITDSRLNIPNAVIKNSLTRGGFVETIGADGSSVERWVGV